MAVIATIGISLASLSRFRIASVARIQQIRIEVRDLRARAALAAATGGSADRESRVKSAKRDAKKILREKTYWGDPFAHLILGGAATGNSSGAT